MLELFWEEVGGLIAWLLATEEDEPTQQEDINQSEGEENDKPDGEIRIYERF